VRTHPFRLHKNSNTSANSQQERLQLDWFKFRRRSAKRCRFCQQERGGGTHGGGGNIGDTAQVHAALCPDSPKHLKTRLRQKKHSERIKSDEA